MSEGSDLNLRQTERTNTHHPQHLSRAVGSILPQILADQLTLSQSGGRLCPPSYYLPRPPEFLDLPKALLSNQMQRHVSLSPGELHLFLCALPDHEQF